MTAAHDMKPRVQAERWVQRGAASAKRRIECRYDQRDMLWRVELHMPTEGVYALGVDVDFHKAMAKAVQIAVSSERRQKRLAGPTKNKRTSRRAR